MMLIELGGKGHLEKNSQDFAGGTVDRNPPVNAGDTCSIPGPEGFHMQQSNWAKGSQLPNLFSRVREPKLPNLCAATTEVSGPRAWAPHQRVAPTCHN